MKKKEPDVRIFTCEKCNTTMYRDLNSAINMAKKERKKDIASLGLCRGGTPYVYSMVGLEASKNCTWKVSATGWC
jgi:transposase